MLVLIGVLVVIALGLGWVFSRRRTGSRRGSVDHGRVRETQRRDQGRGFFP
jgi:hypothetical protein